MLLSKQMVTFLRFEVLFMLCETAVICLVHAGHVPLLLLPFRARHFEEAFFEVRRMVFLEEVADLAELEDDTGAGVPGTFILIFRPEKLLLATEHFPVISHFLNNSQHRSQGFCCLQR